MTGGVQSVAFCWTVERRDGAGLALTSHDRRLVRGGTEYRSDPGVVPAAITRSLGTEPHSGEMAGALTSDALTDEDFALGRWDGARVSLSAVDWQDESASSAQLLAGELGDISIEGSAFSAELRGAADRLLEPICPATSPECRAQLGDTACRVDMAGRTVRANVVAVDGAWLRTDAILDARFLFGRLRYLSGVNCGATTIILAVDADRVRVRDLPRASIGPAAVIELREGCDKRLDTCATRFGNAANFRGEPQLPGNDLLTRYPGA